MCVCVLLSASFLFVCVRRVTIRGVRRIISRCRRVFLVYAVFGCVYASMRRHRAAVVLGKGSERKVVSSMRRAARILPTRTPRTPRTPSG